MRGLRASDEAWNKFCYLDRHEEEKALQQHIRMIENLQRERALKKEQSIPPVKYDFNMTRFEEALKDMAKKTKEPLLESKRNPYTNN